MSTVKVASDFLSQLERSELLTPDQIARATIKLGISGNDSPVAVAKLLVKFGAITRLQAMRLLEGKARGFFVDRFRIDDILGSGGMGWVYVARDMDNGERVALKMLCEQNEKDIGLLTRFKLEAKAGMMIDHQAVVRTREYGRSSGLYGDVHFMVMDLFEGVGIDEFVAMAGPMPWQLACHVSRYMCAGLHHSHRQGLIHRDVKPANVLVDTNGSAAILDFGLSLVSNDDDDDEFSLAMIFGHDCLGTADFIAPEQAVDSFNVDHRADIYGAGATMYYALSGQVLFPDCTTRLEKIEAQKKLHPRPINELVPDLPDKVATIVRLMLKKDPDKRFQTGKMVCKYLEEFGKPAPIRFDFNKILDRRYQVAVQRQKLLDEKSQRARQQTNFAICNMGPSGARASQSAIETTIRKDTEVKRQRPAAPPLPTVPLPAVPQPAPRIHPPDAGPPHQV
ncbi:MAG: serine/threonine-protein kinase [Planctomycetota bacterium]|nr:serine/threonine-protein kinase [Planctomycetota bacterium]MDA1250991.1 serine/threonine-protein kinase [Planctomycetota bacterium]